MVPVFEITLFHCVGLGRLGFNPSKAMAYQVGSGGDGRFNTVSLDVGQLDIGVVSHENFNSRSFIWLPTVNKALDGRP